MTLKNLQQRLMSNDKFRKEFSLKTETELAIRVGSRIQSLRALKGVTQRQLAKKVNTQQPNIARIESGKKLPSLKTLYKIAESMDTYLIEPDFAVLKQVTNITNLSVTLTNSFSFSNERKTLSACGLDYSSWTPTTSQVVLAN